MTGDFVEKEYDLLLAADFKLNFWMILALISRFTFRFTRAHTAYFQAQDCRRSHATGSRLQFIAEICFQPER